MKNLSGHLLLSFLFLNGAGLALPASCAPAKGATGSAETKHNSDSLLKEAMASYTAGHYEEALAKCKKLVINEPQNLTAHYLLGNICVKTNRLKDAVAQYEYLLKLPTAKDSPEAGYAVKALEQIRDQPGQSEPAVKSSAHTSGSTRSAEESIQEQVDILAKEQKEKVAVKQRTLDDKIKQIQDDLKNQIYNMPRGGRRGYAAREASQEAQEQMKQEAQKQIEKLREDFKREVADLDQYYQNRVSALSDYHHNMQQQSGGRSGIR